MIPFGIFLRTVLDTGVVRLEFNNVNWVNYGDGYWSYEVPRRLHKSGVHPRVLLADQSTITGVQIESNNYGTIKLISLVPYQAFTLYILGDNTEQNLPDSSTILKIIPSFNNTFILTRDNELYGVGDNTFGQLGQGNTDWVKSWVKLFTNVKMVSNSERHTVVLLENGDVYAAGDNSNYAFSDTQAQVVTSFMKIASGVDLIATSAFYYRVSASKSAGSTILVFNNGDVKGIGGNGYGELGNSDIGRDISVWTPIPGLTNITHIVGFCSGFMFIDNIGNVYGLGYNREGRFGGGQELFDKTISTPQITTNIPNVNGLYSSGFTSYITTTSGDLYVSGSNVRKVIPNYNSTTSNTHIKALSNYVGNIQCGITYEKTGSTYSFADYCSVRNLSNGDWVTYGQRPYGGYGEQPNNNIQNGFNYGSYDLAVGSASQYLWDNSKLLVSGYNNFGQLGYGFYDRYNMSSWELIISNINGDPEIQSPKKKITQSYCVGNNVNCYMLLENGQLYSTGLNSYGELGRSGASNTYQYVMSNVKDVESGEESSYVLLHNGQLYASGRNRYGQLGLPSTIPNTSEYTKIADNITSISAGKYHLFAVDINGDVYSTGNNQYGQLGLGNTSHVFGLTKISYFGGKEVKTIHAGKGFSSVLTMDGVVHTVGENYWGQLGTGNFNNRTSFGVATTAPANVSSMYGMYNALYIMVDGKLYGVGCSEDGQLGVIATLPSGALSSFKDYTPVDFNGEVFVGDFGIIVGTTDGYKYRGSSKNYESFTGVSGKLPNWTPILHSQRIKSFSTSFSGGSILTDDNHILYVGLHTAGSGVGASSGSTIKTPTISLTNGL